VKKSTQKSNINEVLVLRYSHSGALITLNSFLSGRFEWLHKDGRMTWQANWQQGETSVIREFYCRSRARQSCSSSV